MNWRSNRRREWKIGKQYSRRLKGKILISAEQENLSQKLFCATSRNTRRNKVNFKWHVNVMRSHVKMVLFIHPTHSKWEKKSEERCKKMGKTRRWLSINVNFMRIYYVSIYVSISDLCHPAISSGLQIGEWRVFLLSGWKIIGHWHSLHLIGDGEIVEVTNNFTFVLKPSVLERWFAKYVRVLPNFASWF